MIRDEIVVLIPKIFHPKNGLIDQDTELEEDLGITGDDAGEILFNFSKKFNVNIENFKLNEYFLGEGEDSIGIFKTWFLGYKIKKQGRKRLTIGDLEQAVKKGKLE